MAVLDRNKLDETADLFEERARVKARTPSSRTMERTYALRLLASFIRFRVIAEEARRSGNESLAFEIDDRAWELVRESEPVRLSLAQEALEVTNPTVRAWTEQGLLEDFGGSPKRVSLDSVANVLEILLRIRESGQERDLLAAVLSEIEHRELMKDQRFLESLTQMRQGTRAAA